MITTRAPDGANKGRRSANKDTSSANKILLLLESRRHSPQSLLEIILQIISIDENIFSTEECLKLILYYNRCLSAKTRTWVLKLNHVLPCLDMISLRFRKNTMTNFIFDVMVMVRIGSSSLPGTSVKELITDGALLASISKRRITVEEWETCH